jgi:hypothetical protein
VRLSVMVAGAVLGAAAGAAALVLTTTFASGFRIDFGEAALVRGVYPAEYAAGEGFSWTGREATVELPGLDRRVTWSCAVRLRGAREDSATLPQVSALVDGVTRTTLSTTNEYQQLTFEIPPKSRTGAVLTLASSNTFQPGPSDRRALGVRVQTWTCALVGTALVFPPPTALLAAAAAIAMFGAALGLIGYTLARVAIGVGLLAVGQAAVITQGVGAFAPYATRAPALALYLTAGLIVAAFLVQRRAHQPLLGAGRFVVVYATGALYLKLLALLHPSQAIGDALFHAHRLERVLGGDFYFTQPLASGVEFPYAIGLYLFAAPWSILTHDHVMLLRVVVSVGAAAAGALLYIMVVRTWGDRFAGATAVVLFSLVPVSFAVAGYGNLTNAFGQSVALTAVAGATVWPLRARNVAQWFGLTLLSALALLSHVSTFAILLATLVAIAALFRWSRDQDLRQSSMMILTAAVVAVVFSVAVYYGHFGNVYMKVLRARTEHVVSIGSGTVTTVRAANVTASQPSLPDADPPSLYLRTADALTMTAAAIGWPILILAALGAWRAWKEAARDRLLVVIGGWVLAYVAFVVLGIASPVDAANQRFSAEFIGRVAYTTCPAAVLLAARGGVWAWRRGQIARAVAVALGFGAIALGVNSWLAWVT